MDNYFWSHCPVSVCHFEWTIIFNAALVSVFVTYIIYMCTGIFLNMFVEELSYTGLWNNFIT